MQRAKGQCLADKRVQPYKTLAVHDEDRRPVKSGKEAGQEDKLHFPPRPGERDSELDKCKSLALT